MEDSGGKNENRKIVLKVVFVVVVIVLFQVILFYGGEKYRDYIVSKRTNGNTGNVGNRPTDVVETEEEENDFVVPKLIDDLGEENDIEIYQGIVQYGKDIYDINIDVTNILAERVNNESDKIVIRANYEGEYLLNITYKVVDNQEEYNTIKAAFASTGEDDVGSDNIWCYYESENGYICFYELDRITNEHVMFVIDIEKEFVKKGLDSEVNDFILDLMEYVDIQYRYDADAEDEYRTIEFN